MHRGVSALNAFSETVLEGAVRVKMDVVLYNYVVQLKRVTRRIVL